MTKTAAIAKIEATVAEFSFNAKTGNADQDALLAIFRKLPARKQRAFIKQFAAAEFARLQRKAA